MHFYKMSSNPSPIKVLDVSHVSARGSSYRITLPKNVKSRLDIGPDDIVTFIEKDGEVLLRKIKLEE